MSLDELRGLLERHARANLSTAIEGVRICKADHAVAPESSMSGTVLAVVAQGRKRLAVGDSVHEYSAGQYLVASVDLPVTGHSTDAAPDHPTLGFGMTLEPAAIAELLLQTGPGDLPRSPGSARPGITVSDAGSTGASSALHPALTQIVCEAAIPPLRRCRDCPQAKRIVHAPESILLARRSWRCFDGDMNEAVIRALEIGPDSSRVERTIDITTIGRRSGVPRRIEVWFHRVDGRWYLTGMPLPRSWYANLQANPRFTVHLKHGVTADLPATATPVDDQTRRRVITAVLDLQNRLDVAARVAERQEFDDWFARSPLVEILFDDEELR